MLKCRFINGAIILHNHKTGIESQFYNLLEDSLGESLSESPLKTEYYKYAHP